MRFGSVALLKFKMDGQSGSRLLLDVYFKVHIKALNVHILRLAVVPCLNLGSHPYGHATLLIQRCDMAVQVRALHYGYKNRQAHPVFTPTNHNQGPQNNTHLLMVERPPAGTHKKNKEKQIWISPLLRRSTGPCMEK